MARQFIYHMHGMSKAYAGGKKVLDNIHLSFYPDAKTSSNHKLLKMALPASVSAGSRGGEDDLAQRLRIRSVYIKEPSLVIERAYTPLYDSLPGTASLAMEGATRAEKDSLDLANCDC